MTVLDDKFIVVSGGYDGEGCLSTLEILRVESRDRIVHHNFLDLHYRFKNHLLIKDRDQIIYLVGGWDEKNTKREIYRLISPLSASPKLEYLTDMPYPLECHSVTDIIDGTHVLILGGFDGFSVTDRILKFDFGQARALEEIRLQVRSENQTSQVLN